MDDQAGSERGAGSFSNEVDRPVRDRALCPDMLGSVTSELLNRLVRRIPVATSPRLMEPAEPEQIDAFCDALISANAVQARAFFDSLRTEGHSPDRLCLGFIASAARRLGERWSMDTASFLEVTLGTARLHGLLRTLHAEFAPRLLHQPPELRALFASIPGETHVLGVTMAADFFRRAGWQIDLVCAREDDDLCMKAASGDYPLIGLSVSCGSVYDRLERLVPRLRALCPVAKIVLSGHLVENEPGIVERVGADASALDVTVAPFALQRLVAHQINH